MYTLSVNNQQANFLSVDFMAVSTNSEILGSDQSNVISARVDGSIDVIKIKSVVSGGTNGTHTNIIRGDGTGGVCSVTAFLVVVAGVSVTNAGSGYTFATVSNAQIVVGATSLAGAELDVNYSLKVVTVQIVEKN